MNATTQDEITAYVEGVRAALAGLPEPLQLELLEDLAEHLAEVRAEGQGTLVERLGTPSVYAAELLAAAGYTGGYVGGFPDPPAAPRYNPLIDSRDTLLSALRVVDVKVGPVIGYVKASDFLRLLRPAWWVLRGYLAAMVLTLLLDDSASSPGLLPRIGGSDLLALVVLAVCVAGSIIFGRKNFALSRWPRYVLWSGTAVLVFFALSGFLSADRSAQGANYQDAGSYDTNPYNNVQDVYVYDSQGRLVEGARLFDQDGSPIKLGNEYCSDPNTGESLHTRNLGYPYCVANAPFGPPASTAPAAPSLSELSPSAASPSALSPSAGSPSAPSASRTAPSAIPPKPGVGPSSGLGSAAANPTPTVSPSR